MAIPYIGEIRMFAGNFAPIGWFVCDGRLLPISEYETLFQLIGTTYGGNGQDNFALPDLRGRVPLHFGNGGGGSYTVGETGGVESVTLTVQQIPGHSHLVGVSTEAANQTAPAGGVLAQSATVDLYVEDTPLVAMAASAVSSVGGGQAHTNMQPFTCVNYIISLFGIFPSPN